MIMEDEAGAEAAAQAIVRQMNGQAGAQPPPVPVATNLIWPNGPIGVTGMPMPGPIGMTGPIGPLLGAFEVSDDDEEGSVTISENNPFAKAARAEALDDALVGIQRDEKWIRRRVKEIYQEEKVRVKKPDEPLPDFLLRKDLPGILRVLYKCEYPDKVAQEAFDQIIAEQMKKSEIVIREGISIEKVIVEEVEKRTKVVKYDLVEKNYQDRVKSSKLIITMMYSALFTICIPILGAVLPKNWMMLQMLPMVGVVWLNWKPMVAMHKSMKELKNERENQND